MSSGLLPPVPGLIPISELRKRSSSRSNSSGGSDRFQQECAPCISEVMGEQRSRRRSQNTPVTTAATDLINNAASRGPSTAPPTPPTRKARSERRRKSDRHRKTARTRSISKHGRSKSRENRDFDSQCAASERPANPRVNPIFVWVRQEDNRIVDVKCEDYDKRNRILLTKTAHGWRAIPRTETLVPTLKGSVEQDPQTIPQEENHQQHHHHHRHHKRKSRKSKTRQKSAGSQFPEAEHRDTTEDAEQDLEVTDIVQTTSSPSWMCEGNINVESLLPSHTIHVIKRPSSSGERNSSPCRDVITNVNSASGDCAPSSALKCSAERVCDVSPLDNLLAVAELEFKQQIQSGEWNKNSLSESMMGDDEDANDVAYGSSSSNIDDGEIMHSHFIQNMTQLSDLIESEKEKLKEIKHENESNTKSNKPEECDYNEDDDIAMNDILSRLEQSLQSPECIEHVNIKEEQAQPDIEEIEDIIEVPEIKSELTSKKNIDNEHEENHTDDIPDIKTAENICKDVPDIEECDMKPEITADEVASSPDVQVIETEPEKPEIIDLIESSTNDEEHFDEQDQPTDLSMKTNVITPQENSCDALDGPTDLSIPKHQTSPNRDPRPPSQNSEAIQSPQPSGIPAVSQSPDIVSTSSNTSKNRTIFLESLLTTTATKVSLNSEVTISRQKEPLDLGKCRKSASPTVTCSEEIVSKPSNLDLEPPAKKFKSRDITLKTLLDPEEIKSEVDVKAKNPKETPLETPRLLELLQNENKSPDPLSQFKQLLNEIDIPDPLMVPKSSFADLLQHPRREIIKIISEQPQKNIPINEILVVYKDKLMSALQASVIAPVKENNNSGNNTAQSKSTAKVNEKSQVDRPPQLTISTGISNKNTNKKPTESSSKQTVSESPQAQKNISANDIDAATEAAFNQMMWLPYANHLEALNYASNQEVLQALYNTLPLLPNQMGDINPSLQQMMFNSMVANKIPPISPVNMPPFPPMNFNNPLEFNMWQEAVMQANLLRNKNPFDNLIANQSHNRELNKPHMSNKKQSNVLSNQRVQQNKTVQQSLHHQNMEQQQQHQRLQQEQQRLQQERLQQQNLFSQNMANTHHSSFQNPYLNMGNGFSNNSNSIGAKQGLHVPQFNQYQQQKKHQSSAYAQKQKDVNANFFAQFSEQEKQLHQQYLLGLNQQKQLQLHQQQQKQELKNHQNSRSSTTSKPFGHFSMVPGTKTNSQDLNVSDGGFKPMDLSGCTLEYNKSKAKSIDVQQQQQRSSKALNKSLEDLPEVGSTTASIEEMQAAHKQFWHPLFGNVRESGVSQEDWESLYAHHQGYPPWNTTTAMATAE